MAATQGTYKGSSVTSFETLPFDIDGSNGTFRVSVDGTLTDDIVLTSGSYASAQDLATEIQTQINADATLTSSGLSVAVSFDTANDRFVIKSDSQGSDSTVNVTFAQAGVVSDLGLAVGLGEAGKPATTIADAAAGIQIRVQGTSIGERGTVTLVRGVMNNIETFLEQFIGFNGALTTKLDSLDEQVTDIDEEADDFGARMDLLEERLRLQFAAADALISTLNSTSQFLDRQLATLPGYSNDSN